MRKPILLIDNNDSFTMNINQIVNELEHEVRIIPYADLHISELADFDKIIISPGPGHPDEYTKYKDILNQNKTSKSFLGICLGMQIIGQYFGCKVKHCYPIEHGKQSKNIITSTTPLFYGIPNYSIIGRYHSWSLDKNTIPDDLIINSISEDGEIMSISHQLYSIFGVQFHPESFITEFGSKIIENWILSK